MRERRLEAPENPDIEFTANVRVKKMRFDEVPETEVRFRGHPERVSVSGTERENLPEEVRRGVTYRDVRVRWLVATALIETNSEPWEEASRSSSARRQETTGTNDGGAEAPEEGGRSD